MLLSAIILIILIVVYLCHKTKSNNTKLPEYGSFLVLGHGEYINDKHFIVPDNLTLIFPCKLGKIWSVKKDDIKLYNLLKGRNKLQLEKLLDNIIYKKPKRGILKNVAVYQGGDICPNLNVSMPVETIKHGVYKLPLHQHFSIKLSALEKKMKLNFVGSMFTFNGSLKNFVKKFESGVLLIVTCRGQKNNFDHYAVSAVEDCHLRRRNFIK